MPGRVRHIPRARQQSRGADPVAARVREPPVGHVEAAQDRDLKRVGGLDDATAYRIAPAFQ